MADQSILISAVLPASPMPLFFNFPQKVTIHPQLVTIFPKINFHPPNMLIFALCHQMLRVCQNWQSSIGSLVNSIIWACFFCIPCYDYWAVVRGQNTPIVQVSQYYWSNTTATTTIVQVSHSEGSFPLLLVSINIAMTVNFVVVLSSSSSWYRHR